MTYPHTKIFYVLDRRYVGIYIHSMKYAGVHSNRITERDHSETDPLLVETVAGHYDGHYNIPPLKKPECQKSRQSQNKEIEIF